ncbi:MAG TPA: aldo/keto reductase [Planctomycetota bacterium]|nr:aldo/keto reductase [Planctomycetota bacterium]
MQYRTITGTDVKISAVSLGCWTLGGLQYNEGRMIGWREVDQKDATRAVYAAVDAGVNHFDNADVYGYGRAERVLTAALRGIMKKVVVATKVGYFRGTAEHAYLPHHIRTQCEHSLINLKRDRLDIYYLHNTDFGPDDCYLDGAVETLHRLRDAGKIRLIGLSGGPEGLLRTLKRVNPDVIQSRASMMDRRILEDSPAVRLIKRMKLQVVCFSPLEQGILLGKYSSKKPPQFEDGDVRKQREAFTPKGLRKVEPRLAKLKARFGDTPEELSAAALSFLLSYDHVLCAIPGFRNEAQVKCNVACGGEAMRAENAEFVRKLFR